MDDFAATFVMMLLCFFVGGLIFLAKAKDMCSYSESYPAISFYANRLCYRTGLSAEEIVERLVRHNVMDVFGYEFGESGKSGCYNLRLKEIRKDYEYAPKQGMVWYEMRMEDMQEETLVILALVERSSFGAQARYAGHLNEFMMKKLEARYIPH